MPKSLYCNYYDLCNLIPAYLSQKNNYMGKIYEGITPELKKWIDQQYIFFVATAPLSAEGHINCSPKGLDSLRIIDETTIVYQDLTGSGVETIAHTRENQRIVIMFCAFAGAPKIVRLHGKATAILPNTPSFSRFSNLFPDRIGVRSYIEVKLTRITDSCGFGVPMYEYKRNRDQMDKWAEVKGEQGVMQYQQKNNLVSIDQLPGLVSESKNK
jgi:hypothetical protein